MSCAEAALMGMGIVGIKKDAVRKQQRLVDVLSDFDLRPSWSLSVALREIVKNEMRRAWHAQESAQALDSSIPLAWDEYLLAQEAAGVAAGAAAAETLPTGEFQTENGNCAARCQRKFVPTQKRLVLIASSQPCVGAFLGRTLNMFFAFYTYLNYMLLPFCRRRLHRVFATNRPCHSTL